MHELHIGIFILILLLLNNSWVFVIASLEYSNAEGSHPGCFTVLCNCFVYDFFLCLFRFLFVFVFSDSDCQSACSSGDWHYYGCFCWSGVCLGVSERFASYEQ